MELFNNDMYKWYGLNYLNNYSVYLKNIIIIILNNMSVRRPSTREKMRTPSPITIYSKEISKSKKPSLYNRV
jgi:hypothetical protein